MDDLSFTGSREEEPAKVSSILTEAEELKQVKVEDGVETILECFEMERKVEKKFMIDLGQVVQAKKQLMHLNLSMINDIVEYADFKDVTTLFKDSRFQKPADDLNFFQTTTKAMAKHLYLLEKFRQAEIERLNLKANYNYKQGAEAKHAMNKAILKAVAKEANLCKKREKKVAERYKTVARQLAGDEGQVRNPWEYFKRRKSNDEHMLSIQTWKESTERAKLKEAQNLRTDAEDAVLLKYHELTKQGMEEFEKVYAKYILIEMEFHAKALEELTSAYQCLNCPMKSMDDLDSKPRLKRLIGDKKVLTKSACRKLKQYVGGDGDSDESESVHNKTNRLNANPERNRRIAKASSSGSCSEESTESDSTFVSKPRKGGRKKRINVEVDDSSCLSTES